jgi:hypothetical protein
MKKPRPYVDRGKPGLRFQGGSLPTVPDPPPVPMKTLKHAPVAVSVGVDAGAALEQWALWVCAGLAVVGWPEKTLLARVIEYGALGAAQGNAGSLLISADAFPHDELCEWVEAAVMRLDLPERNVVVRHYLRSESAEVSANAIGISPDSFRQRLSRARRSVKDYLDGRKAALV